MIRKMWIAALASAAVMTAIPTANAAIELHNTVTGEPLNLDDAGPEGKDVAAFKEFLETGKNPYLDQPNCLAKAQELYLGACSGCHGHVGEGKLGPALNDNYWTYPDNNTDKGLFETIFGGASGQMGPMYNLLNVDEILLAMAWVRHMYTGPKEDANWLNEKQLANFKPFDGKDATKPQGDTLPECKVD
ncbi:cytochrome c(L), periplasmic [Hansschlegelia beijingensis]|uniref:cytochrome c(L), periplasmic n=1 Tax=Hansschlegelia beijingensis TaxID=1133344 RepID=UPI00387F12C4